MESHKLRSELEARSLVQLQTLARKLRIAYSGKRKAELIDELLGSNSQRLELMLGPLHWSPDRKKELILVPTERWTMKRRATVFLAIFGGLWLLLEPLSTFASGAGVLSFGGWWGYVCLLGFALFATVISEARNHKKQITSHETVAFFLVFPKSGQRVQVRAPLDMQIDSLLRLYVTKIGDLFPVDCAAMHLYAHNLMIRTAKGFKPVDSRLTLREAGIIDGSICRLRGYIRVEYSRPLLDIEYSWQPVRLELARAEGVVILDEKDTISFDEAKARGLLTDTAIARVDHFQYRNGAEIFVSLCPENEIDDVPALAKQEEVP